MGRLFDADSEGFQRSRILFRAGFAGGFEGAGRDDFYGGRRHGGRAMD